MRALWGVDDPGALLEEVQPVRRLCPVEVPGGESELASTKRCEIGDLCAALVLALGVELREVRSGLSLQEMSPLLHQIASILLAQRTCGDVEHAAVVLPAVLRLHGMHEVRVPPDRVSLLNVRDRNEAFQYWGMPFL